MTTDYSNSSYVEACEYTASDHLGEDVFDDYWMNFFNTADAKKAGIGKPRYNSLETYKAYLDKQQKIRRKLNK